MKVRLMPEWLRDKLIGNREKHKQVVAKAQKVFREKVIEALDHNLKVAREGGKLVLFVQLVTPMDHTEDYDRAISMFGDMIEHGDHSPVEITEDDYQKYVLDQWEWTNMFTTSTAPYVKDD